MTREKCKVILPIIQAFANGENVEYYDSLQITGAFTRGMWRTADNIGFGRPVCDYRIINKDDSIMYFGFRKNI